MRASVSFFLALLFAVTPILQVHGQARPQGPSPPDLSAATAPLTSDARSIVFLEPALAPWVPTLEASSSRWGTALHSDRDILGPATMPVWQDDDGGLVSLCVVLCGELPVWATVVIVVVAAGLGILLLYGLVTVLKDVDAR